MVSCQPRHRQVRSCTLSKVSCPSTGRMEYLSAPVSASRYLTTSSCSFKSLACGVGHTDPRNVVSQQSYKLAHLRPLRRTILWAAHPRSCDAPAWLCPHRDAALRKACMPLHHRRTLGLDSRSSYIWAIANHLIGIHNGRHRDSVSRV